MKQTVTKRKGIQGFIADNMPYEWHKAAIKFRVKDEMVKRIYDTLPKYWTGNHLRHKDVRRRCYYHLTEILFKRELIYAIDVTDINMSKWTKINEYIINLKEQCR